MSIIQEALKKAQADLKPSAPAAETVQAEKVLPTQKVSTPPASARRIPIVTIALLMLVFAILVAGRFLHFASGGSSRAPGTSAQEISYKPIVTDEVKDPNQASGQNQPTISAGILNLSDRPDLVLNGIMYLEEGPRAIINNFIVEPGDLVGGAKVTKINRRDVILEYRNVEITLSLK